VIEDRIIVALDTGDAGEALSVAERLYDRARWLKVGMTLFYAAGPDIVERLRTMEFALFVDLKIHDIPHQAEGAARELARLGCDMMTVHASGGRAMVEAAVRGAARGADEAGLTPPVVLAVTVLTSMDPAALAAIGMGSDPGRQALRLARLAVEAGADGVVCSPQEAAVMRELLGPDAEVVTPGIRPAGTDAGDQRRVATPAAALAAGASRLVVGRPVTAAADPVAAFEGIVAEARSEG
jgi:orotidine-5'-phosphate decarboxylase